MTGLEALLFVLARLAALIAAWLATYAIHSTLLVLLSLAAIGLISKVAPRAHSLREAIWKTALVGAFITATAHSVGLGNGARYDLSREIEAVIWEQPIPSAGVRVEPKVDRYPARLDNPKAVARFLPVLLVLAWLAFAAWVITRVFTADRRARAALGERQRVTQEDVLLDFNETRDAMGVPATVALTSIDRLASPVVIGRAEICLPHRAITELSRDERRAVIAHELAHVVRHDPTWLLVAASIESLFFFQPFNRLVRMRLHDETESLADDLAANHAGGGMPLAKGLARIAEWMVSSTERLLAPALIEMRSSIVRRVDYLTSRDLVEPRRHTSMRVFAAALLLMTVLGSAPGVAAADLRAWGSPAFHWEGVIAPSQTIEVKGVMGDIRAEPWDGSTVAVNVTRHGRSTNPDVRFEVREHNNGVTVCALYPVPAGHAPNPCEPGDDRGWYNTKDNDVEMDFLVRIPRGIAFSARTAVGRISTGLLTAPVTAVSNAGDIDIATTAHASAASSSGNVTVRMGSTSWSDNIGISSQAGNVRVVLPVDAHARVTASSQTGSVHSSFSQLTGDTRSIWKRLALRGSLGSAADGVLGTGGRVLHLQSTTGDVHVDRGRFP